MTPALHGRAPKWQSWERKGQCRSPSARLARGPQAAPRCLRSDLSHTVAGSGAWLCRCRDRPFRDATSRRDDAGRVALQERGAARTQTRRRPPLSREHSYCSAPFCSGFWTKNCLPAGTLASVTESQWERSFISQCSRHDGTMISEPGTLWCWSPATAPGFSTRPACVPSHPQRTRPRCAERVDSVEAVLRLGAGRQLGVVRRVPQPGRLAPSALVAPC